MSDTGKHAHSLLSKNFSNIPEWESLSGRTQNLLTQVGDQLVKLSSLDEQMIAAERELGMTSLEVETSLTEELGSLVVRERPANPSMMSLDDLMKMIGGDSLLPLIDIDASEDPEEDDEPTIH